MNETVGDTQTVCSGCGAVLYIETLRSNAGYYLGFECNNCGPYSRETKYMTNDEAVTALERTIKLGQIPVNCERL